ncbi:helix-turn-helix domain-containing protein [uncultured Clostridium sp.]|uniref:helix-turn-helix transcriptional regulator n=1 Tax=uncultured Clostridium sp. TaxID=59620 RepID=UPI0028E88903|nr:helix-turn-helix domain-containing protein [uncultured Clostridium sp.]
MNISNQLKNYRKEFNISQEELAEIVHVSRQTISNWENNKSYPDLQSLVLISEYFKISLDELVKGDVVNMKSQLDRNEMSKYANGMLIGFVLMLLSIHFAKRIPPYGFIAMVIFSGVMLWSAFKVEKIKKDKNIQTYKEILAYMESGKVCNKDKN